jgi:hypothetical protein
MITSFHNTASKKGEEVYYMISSKKMEPDNGAKQLWVSTMSIMDKLGNRLFEHTFYTDKRPHRFITKKKN